MDYIIIIDPNTRYASALDDDNGFLLTFPTYDEAKTEADDFVRGMENTYLVYGLCTDERNHVV